jgi:hypothetical protein
MRLLAETTRSVLASDGSQVGLCASLRSCWSASAQAAPSFNRFTVITLPRLWPSLAPEPRLRFTRALLARTGE